VVTIGQFGRWSPEILPCAGFKPDSQQQRQTFGQRMPIVTRMRIKRIARIIHFLPANDISGVSRPAGPMHSLFAQRVAI
jgi:hypothetical protein